MRKSRITLPHPLAAQFTALAEQALLRAEPFAVAEESGLGLVLQTLWRLEPDSMGRPRRSRAVRIVISSEALEDYASAASVTHREAADRRFKHWLRQKLAGFSLAPDEVHGGAPPEEWILSSAELNP